jgi:type IV pilus assembly protein PilF
MHSTQRMMPWLLFLAWFVPGLALAQAEGTLIGKLVDPDGNPLKGVMVTATSPQVPGFNDVETTDWKGTFAVKLPKVDVTYHYRFDMPGYESMETNQQWHMVGSQFFQWTMHPAAPQVAGALPAASTSEQAILAYNAGIIAVKAKDNATAEAKFKDALKYDSKLRQGWEQLSTVEVQLGHNQEAADAAEKAIALGSTDQATLVARWQAYHNLKDDSKAAQALKDVERIGRATEEAKKVHNEGVALLSAKDYAGAAAKFQDALNIDPNLEEALIGLAAVDLQLGRNADAATAAEKILKADPKNAQAIKIRYNACLTLGDKARLEEALVGLAAVEPAVATHGLLQMAYEAYDANDMALAKQRFGKLLQIDPNVAQAYYWLGVINVSQGDTAAAKTNLERFLQLAPNDPEAKSARQMLKELNTN